MIMYVPHNIMDTFKTMFPENDIVEITPPDCFPVMICAECGSRRFKLLFNKRKDEDVKLKHILSSHNGKLSLSIDVNLKAHLSKTIWRCLENYGFVLGDVVTCANCGSESCTYISDDDCVGYVGYVFLFGTTINHRDGDVRQGIIEECATCSFRTFNEGWEYQEVTQNCEDGDTCPYYGDFYRFNIRIKEIKECYDKIHSQEKAG